MKILFVGGGLRLADSYPLPKLGGSVQTWGLSTGLAKRGHEVYIIRRNNVKHEETVKGVNLVSINFKGIENIAPTYSYGFYMGSYLSKFLFSKKSLKLIKEIAPDVICLIDRFSGFFPSRLNVPKIYVMHEAGTLDLLRPYEIHSNMLNSVIFYIKKIFDNGVMRRSDKIVALNSFYEEYLRRKGFNNVVKIPTGIDIQNFSNKEDENFVLYAGRFDWNKNVCSLVNIFAQVHKLHPDYHLYLVGAGRQEKRIRSLVKENGIQSYVKIIHWLPRKKLMEFMSRCSVFVLPSFFEVSPVVVLEAMASGKPVIARANMGTVDIMLHGKNGYLYNDENELRKHLESLLSDSNLRKTIGRNARKTVEEKYSFTRIADKYEELFHTLLKWRSGRY